MDGWSREHHADWQAPKGRVRFKVGSATTAAPPHGVRNALFRCPERSVEFALIAPLCSKLPDVSTPKPFSFEPMLCRSSEEPPEGREWNYELKLDGFRAIGRKS